MSMFRSKASQLIELIIPAGYAANQFFYFQNQPQLQSVRGDRMVYIQAISVYNSNHLTASPLTAGNNVASPTDITNGVLTLNVAGTLLYQQIPLVDLVRTAVDNQTAAAVGNARNHDLFLFRDLFEVDWTKSYVQTLTTIADGPFSYLFNVHYKWGSVDDNPDM